MGEKRRRLKLALGRDIFDYLLLAMAFAIFVNIVVALVFLDSNQEGYLGIRKEGFRMVACWVTIMSIGLASAHLRNHRLAILVLSTALGMLINWVAIRSAQAQGAQNTRFELTMSVFAVYFTVPTFMVLLVSTKVDNLHSTLEKERLKLSRASAEAGRVVELLKKSKEQRQEPEEAEDEASVDRRRTVLEMSADIYKKMVRVRFRRDINNLLEEIFSERFGFQQGFVLEAAEEGREMKVKNVWGFGVPEEQADKQISEFKDRELTVWVFERREWLDREKIRKQPSLYEAADRFANQLFGVEYVLPMVSLNRAVNIVYLGQQRPGAEPPFEYGLVEPYLAGLGQVLAKISGKSGKPQFSMFTG